MEKEELKNYQKAGKILAEVLKKAKKSIKPGQKLLEIAEKAEKGIISLQGVPAFPANLSKNHYAAHFSPSFDDVEIVGEKDLLTVDLGVHLDGFVADAAFTIDFSGENGKMIEASEDALEAALSVIEEGVEIRKIGKAIEEAIRKKGFNPIQNLSGHGLERWITHAAPSIPNIDNNDDRVLEDGMVIAIEPFATDGRGFVREGAQAEIFSLEEKRPVRNMDTRKIISFIDETYHTLPFAERWLMDELKISEFKRRIAMRELMQRKCIRAFPILHEEEGRIVAQSETSVILNSGKLIKLV
ncbi:MAG: type II methionyl aminopeptidase [Candidatus Diapherotrites archaeon]